MKKQRHMSGLSWRAPANKQEEAFWDVCLTKGIRITKRGAVSEGVVLHFVYVKKPFRRQGIGRSLAGKPGLGAVRMMDASTGGRGVAST